MAISAADRLKEFRVNACEAISFKFSMRSNSIIILQVKTKADFDSDEEFHPEFAHQIFGESEQIFGYSNLKVSIWYIAGSLSTHIGVSYSTKVDRSIADGAVPDDIYALLSESYPYEYDKNIVDFTKTLKTDQFTPYGTVRHTYQNPSDSKMKRKFNVYFIEQGMEQFDQFLEFHKRMESFLLFFVDGASAIDTEDSQWCYYTLFEVIETPDSTEPTYTFIGYMTVYKFYAYPTNLRPRLSQVIILPPFRNKGHGSQLLQTFYRDFEFVPNVLDITVEDPSDEFRRIRDFLDCKRCLEQPELVTLFKQGVKNGTHTNEDEPVKPSESCYSAFRSKVQKLLKINRCQAKRLFEILQLYFLPRTDEAIESFRNRLHERTVKNFQRARSDVMCGRTAADQNGGTSSKSLPEQKPQQENDPQQQQQLEKQLGQKVFDTLMDECYKTQIEEQVTIEMDAYEAVVCKLDNRLPDLLTSNGTALS